LQYSKQATLWKSCYPIFVLKKGILLLLFSEDINHH
jgi:hypothetical protein